MTKEVTSEKTKKMTKEITKEKAKDRSKIVTEEKKSSRIRKKNRENESFTILGCIKNGTIKFFQSLKNSFSQKLLLAAIIEIIYMIIIFFSTRSLIKLISPLLAVMKNAEKLQLEIQAKALTPLINMQIQEVVDAKNKMIIYFLVFIIGIGILTFFEKGFLWQMLCGKKFNIKKYAKVFLGGFSIFVLLLVILFIFKEILQDSWFVISVLLFTYLAYVLGDVVQAHIMKYDRISVKEIRKSFFSFPLLSFSLVIFILLMILMNLVLLINIFHIILVINMLLVALFIGWYKVFVLEYV